MFFKFPRKLTPKKCSLNAKFLQKLQYNAYSLIWTVLVKKKSKNFNIKEKY